MDAHQYYTKKVGIQHQIQPIINRFGSEIVWSRPSGNESLLDIGCGPGDVLATQIRPLLPKTYSKIVGTDISQEMLDYASENFNLDPKRMAFDILDIGNKNQCMEFLQSNGTFDHITSFYVLHWLNDQKQAFENIYNLMSPGGDSLIALIAHHPYFDFFQMQSKQLGFEALKDVHFLSPYHYSVNAPRDAIDILKMVGYKKIQVEMFPSLVYLNGEKGVRGIILNV